jgi:hypothetical protein
MIYKLEELFKLKKVALENWTKSGAKLFSSFAALEFSKE